MDANDLAKMRQDRRNQSMAMVQPPHPSAAVPRQALTEPQQQHQQQQQGHQTIRFKDPSFGPARTAREAHAESSASAAKRADSLMPPSVIADSKKNSSTPRRKSTAASLFQSRSWSIFWDPRFRATAGEGVDGETGLNAGRGRDDEAKGGSEGEGGKVDRSFLARCKDDRLLHVVLAMLLLVGGGMIIAGVVWSVTHRKRVVEDTRNFACGKGVAGGPRCAVRLKGERDGVKQASWIDGDVVDWWLKNHCVWKHEHGEWWCGAQIGQKQGDEVLPEGTWLEKAEEEMEEA